MTLNNVELRTEVLRKMSWRRRLRSSEYLHPGAQAQHPLGLAALSARQGIVAPSRLARLSSALPPASTCLPARGAPALSGLTRRRRRCACDVRPAQIRVRNAEVVLLAGGGESAAGDGAADGAADVTVKDDAAQTLHNSQMSWVHSLVTQALANLIVDINGLTFRVEMLRRVPMGADPGATAAGGASAAAAPEPQRPRHALNAAAAAGSA